MFQEKNCKRWAACWTPQKLGKNGFYCVRVGQLSSYSQMLPLALGVPPMPVPSCSTQNLSRFGGGGGNLTSRLPGGRPPPHAASPLAHSPLGMPAEGHPAWAQGCGLGTGSSQQPPASGQPPEPGCREGVYRKVHRSVLPTSSGLSPATEIAPCLVEHWTIACTDTKS